MKKLNIYFIIMMAVRLILAGIAVMTEHPLLVALTGFALCIGSSVGYALNGGK